MPLFVKLPHQQRGRVDRAAARTLDIVPTIAAAAGVRIPWRVDGRSLLGKRTPERDVVLVKDAGKRFVVPAAELEARRERALRRQLKLFGSAEPMSSLYAVGPGRERLNHSIQGRPLDAQLDDIDRSSDPVQVSGVVPEATRAVAVVVGGKVVAVAPAAAGPVLGPRPSSPPGRRKAADLRDTGQELKRARHGRHRPGAPGARPPSSERTGAAALW